MPTKKTTKKPSTRAKKPTNAMLQQMLAEMQAKLNAQEQQIADQAKKNADMLVTISDQDAQIVELQTKAVRKNNSSNSTSKGHKFSKNENTAWDLLVFLFQSDLDEMNRIFKGKKAEFKYSEIIEFMQSDSRKEIGDAWGDSSTYIKFPNTDWNYKTSTSCLGRKAILFGFYVRVLKKGSVMEITRATEQAYREKNLNGEQIEKRHNIFMSFIKQDRDGDFTKEQAIRELNDLK